LSSRILRIRARMRKMRLDNARSGFRAPNPRPNCAWLDTVVHRE